MVLLFPFPRLFLAVVVVLLLAPVVSRDVDIDNGPAVVVEVVVVVLVVAKGLVLVVEVSKKISVADAVRSSFCSNTVPSLRPQHSSKGSWGLQETETIDWGWMTWVGWVGLVDWLGGL